MSIKRVHLNIHSKLKTPSTTTDHGLLRVPRISYCQLPFAIVPNIVYKLNSSFSAKSGLHYQSRGPTSNALWSIWVVVVVVVTMVGGLNCTQCIFNEAPPSSVVQSAYWRPSPLYHRRVQAILVLRFRKGCLMPQPHTREGNAA